MSEDFKKYSEELLGYFFLVPVCANCKEMFYVRNAPFYKFGTILSKYIWNETLKNILLLINYYVILLRK